MMKHLLPAALCAALSVPASALGLSEAQNAVGGMLKNAVSIKGRAPLTTLSASSSSRVCWTRAAQETADALGMPRRVCIDQAYADRGDMVVLGEPLSGRLRTQPDGSATLFHKYESEGTCSRGASAYVRIDAAGGLTGEVGTVHDECHSHWDYQPVPFTRETK